MPCPWTRMKTPNGGRKELDGFPARKLKPKKGKARTRFAEAVQAALALGFTLAEARALAATAERLAKDLSKPGKVPSPLPVGGLIALMVLTFLSLLAKGAPNGLATARMAERTIRNRTRFRAPMTGGRGGWQVNMSGIFERPLVVAPSPAQQVRRRGYFAPELGHPGN